MWLRGRKLARAVRKCVTCVLSPQDTKRSVKLATDLLKARPRIGAVVSNRDRIDQVDLCSSNSRAKTAYQLLFASGENVIYVRKARKRDVTA
jgi:hypothetical protein